MSDNSLNDEGLDKEHDPPMPSLRQLIDTGRAFAIPWTHEPQTLCRGFNSAEVQNRLGPWTEHSPFDLDELAACQIIYRQDGGSCSYREASTSRSKSGSEHLSFGGSVSVGAVFLKGEASGQYDKSVMDNDEGELSSHHGSCRLGQVLLETIPRLSGSAKLLLSSEKGRGEFRRRYGDYFVRGYVLGADAGVSVNAHYANHSESEKLSVKITVTVLGWSESDEHTEASGFSNASVTLKVYGYSTLQGESTALETSSARPADLAKIGKQASMYMGLVNSLLKDSRNSIKRLQLEDGKGMAATRASELCRSGLVVQLLLLPYSSLEDYVEAFHR